MLKTHLWSVLIAAVLVMAGCAQSSALKPGMVPTEGSWVITSLNGERFESAEPVQVSISEGRILGRGPVNTWSGPVNAQGHIGMVISTKMAGPSAQMQLESALYERLQHSRLQLGPNGTLQVVQGDRVVVEMTPQ